MQANGKFKKFSGEKERRGCLKNEGNRVEEKRCEVDQQWGWRVVEAAMTGSG